jgi:excisionase family DNA binding protein
VTGEVSKVSKETRQLLPVLFDVDEAAQKLRVKPSTLRGWLSQGKLSRCKVGSRTCVTEAELIRFIEANNDGRKGK